MDAILFSADPEIVIVDEAIKHLDTHQELYWEVGTRIIRDKFIFPIVGYIHVKGRQVEYKAKIIDIVDFSPAHYEDDKLSREVKPDSWIRAWRENWPEAKAHNWKHALVMTSIELFSYNTYKLEKYTGGMVCHPPQNYIRVLPPK